MDSEANIEERSTLHPQNNRDCELDSSDSEATYPNPVPAVRVSVQTGHHSAISFAESAAISPIPNLHVEDFQCQHLIGAGGIAEVWHATHPAFEYPVALKIARESLSGNPHIHAQFKRERTAANLLNHRGLIPHFYHGDPSIPRPFIVMELIHGRSLSHFVKKPVNWAFLRAALIQLCDVLQYTHNKGVLHQDLKPANILVDLNERRIKVTDFGLARFERAHPRATTKHVLGTPAYMAPEQARGQIGLLGPSTDLYTVGVLMYELLSGQKPFSGSTDQETMIQHCTKLPPALQIRSGINAPPTIERVIRRLLSKNPSSRYSSALSLRRVIEAQRA